MSLYVNEFQQKSTYVYDLLDCFKILFIFGNYCPIPVDVSRGGSKPGATYQKQRFCQKHQHGSPLPSMN